ncbi:MAG: hypothetical protein IJX68_08870 [Rikenellaceae bacterium]|nr:hypothetical protein [Rikenellaceae bacterium]
MDWGAGYEATWRIFHVNADTWSDADEAQGLSDISITRTDEGKMESGTFQAEGDFDEGYYRIAMIASQGGESLRYDMATLLCSTSTYKADRGISVREIEGASVLQPAESQVLFEGEYAQAGSDGAQYAAELLRRAIVAPIEVEGAFILNTHIVFDIGTSILDAAWQLLDAGGFCMQIDGRGVVHILAYPATPSLVLDKGGLSMVLAGVDVSEQVDVPNRYIAIEEEQVSIAVNDSPASPTSTVSVGRCIDELDESPTRVGGETLAAYAARRLEEESASITERTYKREWSPDVHPFSIVRGMVPSVGLAGDMRVVSQSIECGNGALVTEKAVIKEQTWTR